jgi:hypothetical protein
MTASARRRIASIPRPFRRRRKKSRQHSETQTGKRIQKSPAIARRISAFLVMMQPMLITW